MMERWTGKVAVVMGASVGIGTAVVKKLLSHNLKASAEYFELLCVQVDDSSTF